MASLGNPRTWIPFINTKKCSQQGLCTFYCPQYCYTIHSPPPQPFEYHHHHSNPNFFPLIVALFIGIFAFVIVLIRYYTIMSKYYYSLRENNSNHDGFELDENNKHPLGVDESVIKCIMICKYKKGNNDGFVGLKECSVCVSEFEEDQSVRVLPKCGHVFHVLCIDTWLNSHSTCPLCRANLFISAFKE